MKTNDEKLIGIIKSNNLLFSTSKVGKMHIDIEEKLNIHNVLALYQFAKLYTFYSLAETTFNFIERCFTILAETNNFSELDFTLVTTILASSQLHITSELEVFNAANTWINYNFTERSKFAKVLLLKVRLPLLSCHALKHLSDEPSSFSEIYECAAILK